VELGGVVRVADVEARWPSAALSSRDDNASTSWSAMIRTTGARATLLSFGGRAWVQRAGATSPRDAGRKRPGQWVGRLGLEPRTHGLKVRCSTIELTPRGLPG
jgi:hypothetical protein